MLTLYHHSFSPSSRFIRLVLAEYQAAFEEVQVNPWERPRALLELNAAGTVPVLVENDGPAICGPGPIMEYLDETRGYAVGDRRLMPDHPDARAETRRLVDWSLGKFDQESGRPSGARADLQTGDAALGRRRRTGFGCASGRAGRTFSHHLRYFGYLVASRRWLAGDRLSFADFALAAEFSCADYLGEVKWAEEENVKNWYARMKSRPGMRPLLSEKNPRHAAGGELRGPGFLTSELQNSRKSRQASRPVAREGRSPWLRRPENRPCRRHPDGAGAPPPIPGRGLSRHHGLDGGNGRAPS